MSTHDKRYRSEEISPTVETVEKVEIVETVDSVETVETVVTVETVEINRKVRTLKAICRIGLDWMDGMGWVMLIIFA